MIPLDRLRPYKADRSVPSPNHSVRKGKVLKGVVLHATADGGPGGEAGSLSWMRNPAAKVSAHLLVHRDGLVTRLVPDERRAWHAGVSEWRGSRDVNSITLGIEIANRNDGKEPFTESQYRILARIAAHYIRQGLTLDDFVSHADIAPKRKTDPAGFDWERFRALVKEEMAPEAPNAPTGGHPLRRASDRFPDVQWPAPSVVPPPLRHPEMVLEPITVPQVSDLERVTRAAGIRPEWMQHTIPPLLALLHAIVKGNEGGRAALAAELIGAAEAYAEKHCRP